MRKPQTIFCPAFDGPCFSADCAHDLCQSALVAAGKSPPMSAEQAIRWPKPVRRERKRDPAIDSE
jgi:hypothetical protein